MLRMIALLAAAGATLPGVASAASSEWFDSDGMRMRLVTEDRARPDGSLRGVLEVELQPGWKTYWKDPGEAGVPPQIDTSASLNIDGATIDFPVPHRFDRETMPWAGYKSDVDFPVTFRLGDPARFAAIDADIFIGVCNEICVPVQARLSVTPDPQADSRGDTVVDGAFATLPRPASADLHVSGFRLDGDTIAATASLPADDPAADLFVVTPPGWRLGAPQPSQDGRSFDIPILSRPTDHPARLELDYTLVAAGRAVFGTAPAR